MIKRLPSFVFRLLRISPAVLIVVFLGLISTRSWAGSGPNWSSATLGTPLARDLIFVYNDWSAYDELSDNIPLTEELDMKELDEILLLPRFGIPFDYYMMDAFWFDPEGGYSTWRKPNWPDGPDAWIKKCRDNGVLPGVWFSANTLDRIHATPTWQELAGRTFDIMAKRNCERTSCIPGTL